MSQVKEGDYIYLHTIRSFETRRGISTGVYKAYLDEDGDVAIRVKGFAFLYYLNESRYRKLIPNKINKLLYREVI